MDELTTTPTYTLPSLGSGNTNARLHIQEVDGGPIELNSDSGEPESLCLSSSVVRLDVPRASKSNYTRSLFDDDRAKVVLAPTTFRGIVQYRDEQFPVEGAIDVELNDMHLLGLTDEIIRADKRRYNWAAIEADVMLRFKTIAVNCSCSDPSWINCPDFYTNGSQNPTAAETISGPTASQRYIDVFWDAETRVLSRTHQPRRSVSTELSLDEPNTVPRRPIEIDRRARKGEERRGTPQFHSVTGEDVQEVQKIIDSNIRSLTYMVKGTELASPLISLTGSIREPRMEEFAGRASGAGQEADPLERPMSSLVRSATTNDTASDASGCETTASRPLRTGSTYDPSMGEFGERSLDAGEEADPLERPMSSWVRSATTEETASDASGCETTASRPSLRKSVRGKLKLLKTASSQLRRGLLKKGG
ncbi:hypothetical protein I302_103450 [Kwoniella bestiolae CBS 10118]|uniref:Uncharacterized protein n=1 Tax=Kwoniella bestiolae CBS 10118 TaxID=1296100 RepID=A0A1B9G8G4_9TREE|nr:hypothetical protein I302_02150 [Kwoniella bestiolae CBS 10118]OCF27309.1 hypothetical protein I302_02150 [Kwoniella bestiolae CBS 10118]